VRWMEANGGSIVNITADIWGGWARLGALWGGASWNAFFHRIGGDRTGAFRCQSQRRRARVRGFERHGPTLKAQAMFRRLRHSVPLKRLGTEAEVAAASFLLSPASRFTTGPTFALTAQCPTRGPFGISRVIRIRSLSTGFTATLFRRR
jgi:citronellol/citronellal dehydrogenase